LGLNSILRQLLSVKTRRRKNILQNVNIKFRRGKEKKIVNFWQAKYGIIGEQTEKQLW